MPALIKVRDCIGLRIDCVTVDNAIDALICAQETAFSVGAKYEDIFFKFNSVYESEIYFTRPENEKERKTRLEKLKKKKEKDVVECAQNKVKRKEQYLKLKKEFEDD